MSEFVWIRLYNMEIKIMKHWGDYDLDVTSDGTKLIPVWFDEATDPVDFLYGEQGWDLLLTKPAFDRYRDFFDAHDRIGRCSRWICRRDWTTQDAVPGFYLSVLVYNIRMSARVATIETKLPRDLVLHVRSFLWW
jgi:hypothetical protein